MKIIGICLIIIFICIFTKLTYNFSLVNKWLDKTLQYLMKNRNEFSYNIFPDMFPIDLQLKMLFTYKITPEKFIKKKYQHILIE